MKTLYLDCGMGAAGDMLSAALLELVDEPAKIIDKMNSLGLPGVSVAAEKAVKCGITGTYMHVDVYGEEEGEEGESECEGGHGHHHGDHEHRHGEHGHHEHHEPAHHEHHHHERGDNEHHHDHEHHHHHTTVTEIKEIVRNLPDISEKVKTDIISIYSIIADAESKVHGVPVDEIHFHEVGSLDAIADVTLVCLLMEELAVDEVVVSPVHVGFGKVRCAHGILPVPAPATAEILTDVPVYGGRIEGELCTPTGAALLKYFATRFGNMPVMTLKKTGYGMGKKDFPVANCVRTLLGECADGGDEIIMLSFNTDDMTGEEAGFAIDRLFEGGALDVFTTGISMKKSRPGILFTVLCKPEDKTAIRDLIFKHTTTIGIREQSAGRYVLKRETVEINTEFGPVRIKKCEGYGTVKSKPEYEDIARIAKEENMSLKEVKDRLNREGLHE